jgi:hypothetical protein
VSGWSATSKLAGNKKSHLLRVADQAHRLGHTQASVFNHAESGSRCHHRKHLANTTEPELTDDANRTIKYDRKWNQASTLAFDGALDFCDAAVFQLDP